MLGTRQTVLVGFVTAILIGFIGTNVGLISGYFGGVVDEVLMRITDFFYAIPFLPFMMVMVALIDRSLPVIIGSMAFIFWRTAARVVRAQVLTLKTRPYVLAARASGAGHLRIMYVHILPNVLPLGLLYLIFGAAWAILTESSLSFIGLGDPNHLSWGLMLNQAFVTGSIRYAWWWVVPPGPRSCCSSSASICSAAASRNMPIPDCGSNDDVCSNSIGWAFASARARADLHALDGISFAVERRRVARHRRRIRLRQDHSRARDPAHPSEQRGKQRAHPVPRDATFSP